MTDIGNGKVRVRVGDLMEDTYGYLYHHMERPRPVLVGANSLTADGATLSVQDSSQVNVTDRLERGYEQMLVTKRDDSSGVVMFTVIRKYENTPNEGEAPPGTALLKNVRWKRHDVWRALLQGLSGSVWTALPFTQDDPVSLDARVVPLPADTLGVTRVAFFYDPYWGTRVVDDWQFLSDVNGLPALEVTNALLGYTHDVQVRRKIAYPFWTDETGTVSATLTHTSADERLFIDLWRGTEDIAALYAAAFRLSGREYSRTEVTAMEGWNADAASRMNINLRAIQTLWQQFYTRLEEARRDHPQDLRRPYHRRVRLSRGSGWPVIGGAR